MIYNETEARVTNKGTLVLSGGRDTNTGLWILQIDKKDTKQREKNMVHTTLDLQIPRTHSAANANHVMAASV